MRILGHSCSCGAELVAVLQVLLQLQDITLRLAPNVRNFAKHIILPAQKCNYLVWYRWTSNKVQGALNWYGTLLISYA